ncbi:hypothetical protein P4S68_04760 [Pseudoalteromonas sp. Hal099]
MLHAINPFSGKNEQKPESAAMPKFIIKNLITPTEYFSQWLVTDFIGLTLSTEQQTLWQQSCELLTNAMLAAQPI